MIVDTHVHFIDPTRPQGAPYPDPQQESRLYRTVLPHHYKAITARLGVTGVVVVEASHWVEDNQWILDMAAGEPLIVGFSGNLDMREDSFEDHVNRFAANPLFRGIRARSLESTDYSTPAVLRAAEILAEKDLQMDVNMGYYDMEHLLQLADAVPQLRIVINHIGAARPIDGVAANPEWADVMRRMAGRPNVFCKVSAVLQHSAVLPAPEGVDFYRPTLDVLWDAFGEDRLMYGSNWPNVEQIGPYSQELAITSGYFREKGDAAAEKFLWRNGKAVYKWIDRSREAAQR